MVIEVRTIDADRLIEDMGASCLPIMEKGISGITGDESCIVDHINAAPTVDAVPVVHARIVWRNRQRGGVKKVTGIDEFGVEHSVRYTDFHVERTPYCSACGKILGDTFLTYCSACGARMDGGEEDG